MHRTDKYSQHSSIILLVWLNGWEFVYKLSGCGFEFRCCHLIFKLWFFVRVFSKTLIVNYVVFTMQLGSLCLASWVYWERTFYASKNVHMIFSSSGTYPPARYLHQRQNTWNLHFDTSMEHLKLDSRNRVFYLKDAVLFIFCTWYCEQKLQNQKNYHFNACMDIPLPLHWS